MSSLERVLVRLLCCESELENFNTGLADTFALKPAGVFIRVKFPPVQRTLTRAMLHLCPDLALEGSGTW